MNETAFELEWNESRRLLFIELPILIQKIVIKAYPTIGAQKNMMSDLEQLLKKIAITEIETAIAHAGNYDVSPNSI